MSSSPVVHVVDDDAAMRESLQFLLESSGFSVTLHSSAETFLEALDRLPSGCILTDIRMPGLDGLELLRRLNQTRSPFPVVMMTGHGDVPLAVEAMKLGAADFIEKPFGEETLLTALGAARERAVPLRATRDADPALQDFRRRLESLSGREREVLDHLVAGAPNKAIARHLAISPRTVEIYRANLMRKMQVASLSELVGSAVRAGIA